MMLLIQTASVSSRARVVTVFVTDVVESKAARCLFDESLIGSFSDLEKMTERGRRTKIKLNIDPPPYGRCCFNRFDPVARDTLTSSLFVLCNTESSLMTDVAVYVTDPQQP